MASILGRTTNWTLKSSNRDEIYIATVPLKAPRGPAQFLMSSIYSFNLFHFQHFMVILNPPNSQALVFDFQPQDPEDIFTAIAALSGKKVPGVVLARKIKNLPRRKCWFVGYSKLDSAANAVEKFNGNWDTDLSIGYHDCRNYVDKLAEYLTGEKSVLEKLRNSHMNGQNVE